MIPQSEDVSVYLELHKEIDLVIPRGSYKLVQTIEVTNPHKILFSTNTKYFCYSFHFEPKL